jgi:hypothetical protein
MRRLLAAFLLLLLLPLTSRAQDPNQAGLVIQYGDGHIETSCVSFEEAEISGFELLQRSGLPMSYDAQAGTLVCSIGGEGCAFPADSCLCRCSGVGSCVYWSYHQLDAEGNWRYSQLGAAVTQVRHGEVNGWRWGEGGANDAPPPVGVTFESLCAAPAPSPVATVATIVALPTDTRPAAATPTVRAEATASAAPSPTPRLEGERGSPSTLPYLLFGLVVLLLGAGVVWARRS